MYKNGMSDHLIDQIVVNAHHITTTQDLTALCHVWGDEEEIMMAVDMVKEMELT